MTLSGYTPPKSVNVPSGGNPNILGTELAPTSLSSSGPVFQSAEDIRLERAQKRQKLAIGEKELLKGQTLDSKLSDDLLGFIATHRKLKDILGQLDVVKPNTGAVWGKVPLSARQYMDNPEVVDLLGSLQKEFDLYRKYITGVQAGFPEIKALKESFPNREMKPDLLKKRLQTVLSDYEDKVKTALRVKKKEGFMTDPYLDELEMQDSFESIFGLPTKSSTSEQVK